MLALRSSLLPATAAAVEVGRRSRLMQSPMLTRSVLTIPLPSEPMSTRLTSGLMLTCLPELELADRRLPGELGLLKLFGRSSTRSGLPLGAARLMWRPARLLRLRSSDKLLCVPCTSSREVRLLLGRPAEGISKGACSLLIRSGDRLQWGVMLPLARG